MMASARVLILVTSLSLSVAGAQRAPSADRRESIRRDIERIEEECRLYGGGDWTNWFAKLATFRAELSGKIQAAKPFNPQAEGVFVARDAVIEAVGDPPLFEGSPAGFVRYLYSPTDLEEWVKTRPSLPAITAVSKWLKKRGIDLIFIPVPKMTEVYANRVVSSVPEDQIVAPQMRRMILELLKADVEVVDLLPLFLASKSQSKEPLYYPADTHWSGTGRMIAAREIARRLARYDFVRKAMKAPRIFKGEPVNPQFAGAVYPALSEEQKKRIEGWTNLTILGVTPLTPHQVIADDCPVRFMGDSYNIAVPQIVANEINLSVSDSSAGGQTSGALKDFLRDPALLDGCRVLIWINEAANFNSDGWALPPRIFEEVR